MGDGAVFQRDVPPTWDQLKVEAFGTEYGKYWRNEQELRAQGLGSPHTDANLRLFGGDSKEEVRVTFFRDTAAWCPYCQKVWLLLEEKQISYRVEKINMRSYGPKPKEFLEKVPNGLLPAIDIDGQFQTDSLGIMMNLERTFTGTRYKTMWPTSEAEGGRAQKLMRLERQIFSQWCELVFRPSFGPMAERSRKQFEMGLDLMDQELTMTGSPWFLNELSIVDLTYISHLERMAASVANWGGFKILGDGRWPAIERWVAAFEEKVPAYLATKSDYYTHVQDIPPQYGPGYDSLGCAPMQAEINGRGTQGGAAAWRLPLPPLTSLDLEPYNPALLLKFPKKDSDSDSNSDEAARHEAAVRLIENAEKVAKFACRGAGQPGRPAFQAPLADPFATAALELLPDVEASLRCVSNALLRGPGGLQETLPLAPASSTDRAKVAFCLQYLRDRIGVPRDMTYPAARQLRAHLNWCSDQLQTTK
jgi:glutathione S-transferase